MKTVGPSEKNPISRKERQKIISTFMLKHTVFGMPDTKEKSDSIKSFILDRTDTYSDTDMHTLMNALVNEYQRRKTEYHRQSLIQKDFILDKIQALREEDKRKGSGSYFGRS